MIGEQNLDKQTNNERNEKMFFAIVFLIFAGMIFSGVIMIFFPEFKSYVRPILNGIGILFAIGIGGIIVSAIVKSFIDSANRGTVKIEITNGQIFEPGNVVNVELDFEVPKPQRIERVTAQVICFSPVRQNSTQTSANRRTRNILYRAQTILAENFDVNPMRTWHKDFQISIPEKVDSSMRETDGISVDISSVAGSLSNSFAGKAISAISPQLSQAFSAMQNNENSYPGIEERQKVEKELKNGIPLVRTVSLEEQMRGNVRWYIEVIFEANNSPNATGMARLRIVLPEENS